MKIILVFLVILGYSCKATQKDYKAHYKQMMYKKYQQTHKK
jgi:hypothetical protein